MEPDSESSPRLADQIDQALGLLWHGDSAAFERLAADYDETSSKSSSGSNVASASTSGVGGALREAAQWIRTTQGPIDGSVPEIPGFEIVRLIGHGGMGVVYEARQFHPERMVALKVLQPGRAADHRHRAMFEHEIRALASLDHPGIAGIHSAGVTADGRSYFVMDVVHGESITAFATRHELNLSARLDLAARLCDAVHHAHMRGVIHRDLKPSNILVLDERSEVRSQKSEVSFQYSDGLHHRTSEHRPLTPTVKILDFGLARLMNAGPLDDSISIDSPQIKGTLNYMSPEQMRGEAAHIDARTDVYALGVILFELLTGRLPVNTPSGSLSAMIRAVEDFEPTAPSQHNRECRGDVDVIVQMAMSREPARRYQSAAQLADDLRRCMHHEPILARPAAALYVLGRYARRHRALVAATASIAVTLITALAAVSAALIHARASLNTAKQAHQEMDKARTTADRINAFLNTMLASPDPEVTRVHGFSVQTMLDDAVAKLDAGALADLAEAEAGVRTSIANSLTSLGAYPSAVAQFERAVDLLRTAHGELSVAFIQGQIAYSQALLRNDNAPRALEVLDQALALERRLEPHNERLAIDALHIRAVAQAGSEFGEVGPLIDTLIPRAVALEGADSTLLAEIRFSRAQWSRDRKEAIDLMQQSLATFRRNLGPDDDRIARTLLNLGFLLTVEHRDQEALAALHESIAMRERLYGPDHPAVAVSVYSLAYLHRARGRYELAAELYQRALRIQEATLIEGHYDTARTHFRLGRTLLNLNRLNEAEQHLRSALAVFEKRGPRDRRYHFDSRRYLASCLVSQNEFEDAEVLLLEGLAAANISDPPAPQYVLMYVSGLISLYELWGKADLAARWRERQQAAVSATDVSVPQLDESVDSGESADVEPR